MNRSVALEAAAAAVCDQSAVPPRIYQLPPEQGRRVLEEAQDAPVYQYPARVSSWEMDTGEWRRIPVYLVSPAGNPPLHRVIFYLHGAGWVFGSFHTHEKLVRELCARTRSLVIFPEYTRAPEARYPVAIEQCYFVLSHLRVVMERACPGLTVSNLTVAGDSVGGNMAIAMALMAKDRGGPRIRKLLLYYPVTNAYFDTPTYRRFAENYYLYRTGMQWFWRQYAPHPADRNQITASPLRASLKQLQGLPETMVICGQADVLRSEGEAFAEKLRRAGVEVTALQIQGTIHDFVMLNALDKTNACRIAMDASVAWLEREPNA